MGVLLFQTDGHNGPVIPASSPSGVTLYGDQAPLVRRGIQYYAESEGIPSILDGGDENTYEENGEDFSDFRESTIRIRGEFNGTYYVINGNHAVNGKTGRFYQDRTTELITDIDGFEDTSLLLMQPRFIWGQGDSHFRVDDEPVIKALDAVETKHLMVAFHWSLEKSGTTVNTSGRKSPSLRGDFSNIRHKIDQLANSGVDVLCLSGHSHCFAMATRKNVRSMIMPSFVQHDVDYEDEPCGLSAVIEEQRDSLAISFRKTLINPGLPKFVSPAKLTQKTTIVDLEYMERYVQKPFIPPRRRGVM